MQLYIALDGSIQVECIRNLSMRLDVALVRVYK